MDSWWYLIHNLLRKSGYEMIFLVIKGSPKMGDKFIIENVFSSPQDLDNHAGLHGKGKIYDTAWIVPAIRKHKKEST